MKGYVKVVIAVLKKVVVNPVSALSGRSHVALSDSKKTVSFFIR
jgi:hypothetical protein